MPLAFPNTQRDSLPDVMTFRKTWRVYQSRLLDHIDGYLQNNRLHLVAAPGSGKTVLGLEVIRRLRCGASFGMGRRKEVSTRSGVLFSKP
jgi:hypothetical protein